MTENTKAYLQLHASVFLWGFTAILGKLITVTALPLVWWRMGIASFCFLFILKGYSFLRLIPTAVLFRVILVGAIVAFHWLCFYGSIKYANASVALVCLTTTSLFTAVFEPIVFKTPFQKVEFAIAIVIIPAMALIVSDLDFKMMIGVILGILAAFGSGLFSVLNKKLLNYIDPIRMTAIELGSGFLILSLIIPFFFHFDPEMAFLPSTADTLYLILLSVGCTVVPFTMSLYALKKLSAFTTVLAINLEPVYGIAMAWFILQENKELNFTFYFGVSVILVAVFLHPFLKRKFK
ncbi:MAG: DMT family transporter [Saprospiraceae bacterium]